MTCLRLSTWVQLFVFGILIFLGAEGEAATIASQDFGQAQIGAMATVNVAVPAVTPGPAKLALRYSIDFSLGACVANGNGCSVPVTFNATKVGLRQDALIVADANGQVVEEIFLHGIGVGPLVVFSPGLATLEAYLPPGEYNASGLAATPDGKVYVAGSYTRTIYLFDGGANSLTAVGGLPTYSGLSSISSLATDAAGNLYYGVAYSGLHRFDVLSGSDEVLASDLFVGSVAVSAAGTVFYVAGDQVFSIDLNTRLVTLIAGNGTHGFGGDGGPAVDAEFAGPAGLAVDNAGDLYIADSANCRVRKVDGSGIITTIAGDGDAGNTGDGGLAINAGLYFADLLAADATGDIYISTLDGTVRRVDAGTGLISTVVGTTSPTSNPTGLANPFLAVGFSGSAQYADAAGGMGLDGDGNLWAVDNGLYKILPAAAPVQFPFAVLGQAQTQAFSVLNAGNAGLAQPTLSADSLNSGSFSAADNCPGQLAPGSACSLSVNFVAGLDATPEAEVHLSESGVAEAQTIAVSGSSGGVLPTAQQVAAVAVGSSSATPQTVSVQFPGNGCCVTAKLAYGTEFRLEQVSCSGTLKISCTAAVTFSPKFPGVRQDAIQFLDPEGWVIYQCTLSGTGQGPQWFVDLGTLGTLALPGGSKLSAIDAAGNLYAVPSDSGLTAGEVFRYNSQMNEWAVVAGQTISGVDTGDGGLATQATLSYVNAVALDAAGNLYIAETFQIRRVDGRTGIIATISQQGGDSIAVDRQGYIYLGNSGDNKVFKVDPTNGISSVFAGNGQLGSSGDGGPSTAASLFTPASLAFDEDGNLFIGETYGIRKVDVSSGIITTYSSECGSDSLMFDAAGDLYFPCGDLQMVAPGGGTPQTVETGGLDDIFGPMLRDASGTFYTSNGVTLSPTPASSIGNLSTDVGASATRSVGLANAGNEPIDIKWVTWSGSDIGSFSQSNNCGQRLTPTQNCTLTVNFAPLKAGTLTASLQIASNLPDLTTPLSGVGVVPQMQAIPSRLSFGDVPVGSSGQLSLMLENQGAYPLFRVNIVIVGVNSADFSVTFDGSAQLSCYGVLAPGQTCGPVTVTYQPSAAENSTGTLIVTADDIAYPVYVPVSGISLKSATPYEAVWGGWNHTGVTAAAKIGGRGEQRTKDSSEREMEAIIAGERFGFGEISGVEGRDAMVRTATPKKIPRARAAVRRTGREVSKRVSARKRESERIY